MQASLRDSSERVAQVAQKVFLPAFAMWAAEIGRLDTDLVQRFVDKLEDLVRVRFLPYILASFNKQLKLPQRRRDLFFNIFALT